MQFCGGRRTLSGRGKETEGTIQVGEAPSQTGHSKTYPLLEPVFIREKKGYPPSYLAYRERAWGQIARLLRSGDYSSYMRQRRLEVLS